MNKNLTWVKKKLPQSISRLEPVYILRIPEWRGGWVPLGMTLLHYQNFILLNFLLGFLGSSSCKEHACQCRRHKRHGFNPWVRKFPWKLQYPCLENPLGRRFWWTTVHRVAKSPTRLKQHSTHTQKQQSIHSFFQAEQSVDSWLGDDLMIVTKCTYCPWVCFHTDSWCFDCPTIPRLPPILLSK